MPKLDLHIMYSAVYFIIIDIIDILSKSFVLSIACIATDKVGCIYKIIKNGPIK